MRHLKISDRFSIITCFMASALTCGIIACSGDSSSDPLDENEPKVSSSSLKEEGGTSQKEESSSSGEITVTQSSSSTPKSSASVETVSSEEKLNAPSNVVNGSCASETSPINKGELATWTFYRENGDVFSQILAPFVWTLPGASTEILQGNGLQTVNTRYTDAGTYAASLNVDGNTIQCSELQVQGVKINVTSCKPNVYSAKVGETITWTVVAESESKINGYSWSTTSGSVSENGAEGSITAISEMHKTNIAPTVTVTNEDKTSQNYLCESVTVVDPNQVDVTIQKTLSDSSSQVFPGGQTIVAQYATGIVNCMLVCGAEGNGVLVEIDGIEHTIDYSLNITPEACSDGSAAGTKITVTASQNVYCYATY